MPSPSSRASALCCGMELARISAQAGVSMITVILNRPPPPQLTALPKLSRACRRGWRGCDRREQRLWPRGGVAGRNRRHGGPQGGAAKWGCSLGTYGCSLGACGCSLGTYGCAARLQLKLAGSAGDAVVQAGATRRAAAAGDGARHEERPEGRSKQPRTVHSDPQAELGAAARGYVADVVGPVGVVDDVTLCGDAVGDAVDQPRHHDVATHRPLLVVLVLDEHGEAAR